MKSSIICLILSFSFLALAEEVPMPGNVTTYVNPTMNGIPFMAADAQDYFNSKIPEMDFDVNAAIVETSQRLCKMLGFAGSFTFSLHMIDEEQLEVLQINSDLVASPLITHKLSYTNTEDQPQTYRSSVFSKISCLRK